MPHTGAPPVVDNQPVINTQGTLSNPIQPSQVRPPLQLPPPPTQPFQLGQRDTGSMFPGIGLLQGLLGREGRPSLPANQQVSIPELSGFISESARSGDAQRTKTLKGLLERRQDVGPQGPLSTETPLTTADPGEEKKGIFDRLPFNVIAEDAFGGLLQDPNQ